MIRIQLIVYFLLGCVALQAAAGDEFFETEIRPLLHDRCSQCHGEALQTAGIDFRDPATVLGSAVVSGDESSPLIRAVRYESTLKMPPDSKLSEGEINALVLWVRMGAPWPGYEPVAAETAEVREDPVESDHWAFQPLSVPEVPGPFQPGWVRNDIDRFILARLRASDLDPAPRASKLALLRRAKFDLLGLPPTETEIQEFLADTDELAFARVVEQFLGSPHYGERWGRHWLDVARYADSTGVDEDHPFGDSWRYRDYVVDAFNEDLPYDQFVREQIAGDLLPAADGSSINRRGIIATGFLALGPMALAQRDPIQKKYDVVDEQVDTTSKAFLGLTIACARCHDHKFDPILTSDYYALAGIFASTRTFDNWSKNGSRYYKYPLVEADVYATYSKQAEALGRLESLWRIARRVAVQRYIRDGPGQLIAAAMLASAGLGPADGLEAATVEWFREYLAPRASARAHLEPWHAGEGNKAAVAAAYQAEFLGALGETIERTDSWFERALEAIEAETEIPNLPSQQPDSLFYRDLRADGAVFDLAADTHQGNFASRDRKRVTGLKGRIESAKATLPAKPSMANAVTEDDTVRQRIFRRGQHKNPGTEVPKRFPLVLAGTNQPEVETGSGRRELAAWLGSEENPLTARVLVNRVWVWHFGEGLVRTPNNYGMRGEPPTHPLLLDWLAQQFIDSGWSIKSLHRLIMNSATYQMSSAISENAYRVDSENRLWSRFERRRLTIEELRDSYLLISGRLDPAVGGDTDLGSGTLAEFDRNNRRINPDDSARRSIYLPLMRNKLPNLLGLFDFGDATTANGKRSVTNVAPQALYLMNSGFALSAAGSMAAGLDGPAAERVRQAYLLALGRPPSSEESKLAMEYVGVRSDAGPAWASLCKMLLASNEFHYVE
ncbi:MAG: DUF1553 domain-containing protein [Bryobacterales bacterium]|nr:DUF1553 domain-containing protein [Bryobacterales bacterium]